MLNYQSPKPEVAPNQKEFQPHKVQRLSCFQDIRVTVESDCTIVINFKGVRGSPMVCGICIRKAVALVAANLVTEGNALCKRCSVHVRNSPVQTRTSKLISKYEKQIEELTSQCNMKSDECYMAWSSVQSTNQELERLKIELHQKVFQSDNIEQVLERQTDQLRNVSHKYENAKKYGLLSLKTK
ncbi:hypothetical protein ABZP36_028739 [Zizania latifolia]